MGKSKARSRDVFRCDQCGFEHPQWVGQCQECGAWGGVDKATSAGRSATGTKKVGRLVSLARLAESEVSRVPTGNDEFDRALGGGLVPGSVVLLGGEPGIGKSTLLLQVAASLTKMGRKVIYACGEESPEQIAMRARRLGVGDADFALLPETDVEVICEAAREERPDVVVVDSIQTVSSSRSDAASGSAARVREACAAFVRCFKGTPCTCILVGHVTKTGLIAGPKLLEHMVDTVLYFEGDAHQIYRFVRAVKNRFGPAGELGVYTMREDGLAEVPNPSRFFVSLERKACSGSALTALVEGTRSMLVEVQGLVTENAYSMPRRIAQGFDANRLSVLASVIEKHLHIALGRYDICVNVTGGVEAREPACDLAVVMAVLSSLTDRPLAPGACFVGEVGLAGEIRPVVHLEKRLAEGLRLGVEFLAYPATQDLQGGARGLEVRPVADVKNAFETFLPGQDRNGGKGSS